MPWRVKEPFNTYSHGFGLALAVPGLISLMLLADGEPWRSVTFGVYGMSLIAVYMASSLYHGLHLSEVWEERFRRFDHVAIFLLIAGSYTPICLITLGGVWGWSVFIGIWILAVAGIAMKIFMSFQPPGATSIFYTGMGWFGAIAIVPLFETVPIEGMAWLIGGGLIYTIGALVYAFERPDPFPKVFGHHEIFHVFVLGGSIAHFVFVAAYIG